MKSDECLLNFLKIKYIFYNKKIFNNLLPYEIIIKIVPYKNFVAALVVSENIRIEFTNFYSFTEDELIDILLHEMIHVYDYKINNGPKHGAHNRKFRKLMYGINIRYRRNIKLCMK